MFSVYSNLKQCVENLDESVPIDSIIAHFILEHHTELPQMSIRELSQRCTTSQASITRFCHRVNNSDFKTLKEEIGEYNNYLTRETSNQTHASEQVGIINYFQLLKRAIEENRQLLSETLINQAVQMIHQGKSVYFFGSSFSNNVAKNACDKFARVNKLAFSFSSVKAQRHAVDLIDVKDVAVFISFSGTNQHINRLYRAIKKKKCTMIWITANPRRQNIQDNKELILPISSSSLSNYETALLESISLNVAIDLLYLQYTNFMRANDRVK